MQFIIQCRFRRDRVGEILHHMTRLQIVFGMGFIEGIGRMPGATPDFVEPKITGNGEQPSGEFAVRFIAFSSFPNLDKSILRNVLRLVEIVNQPVDEVHYRLLELFHQHLVGRQVPLLHPQHQGNVRIVLISHLERT